MRTLFFLSICQKLSCSRAPHGTLRMQISTFLRGSFSWRLTKVGRWNRISRLLLNPGDTVLVEEWTFPSALASAHPIDVRWKGVPMDSQGMRPDSLREILAGWNVERDGPRCVCAWNLPFGPTMKPEYSCHLDRG